MGPTWVLSAPGGPHVGPMNLAIRDLSSSRIQQILDQPTPMQALYSMLTVYITPLRHYSLAPSNAVQHHKSWSLLVQIISLLLDGTPYSKVHGAIMGPTWVLSAPGGPHVDLMNLAIRDLSSSWMPQSLDQPPPCKLSIQCWGFILKHWGITHWLLVMLYGVTKLNNYWFR